MSDTVITVDRVSKRYQIGATRTIGQEVQRLMGGGRLHPRRMARSLLSTAFPARWPPRAPAPKPADNTFWALKDMSFEVKRGEVVGIVGRNGAGKSTLLKILSRVTSPTSGQITIRGRVGSLLEVGTGFHPELTGRENIFLNGVTLGLKRSEIQKKFEEIVEFSELPKFIDTPVKHYSSGMYMRLAFSVAAHLLAEIMIIDEVLAVGDAAFQKKCLGKMEDVATQGRTVLFVSHSMTAVESLCTRGLLLEDGRLAMDDTAEAVADRYMGKVEDQASNVLTFPDSPSLRIQVLEARLLEPVMIGGQEHVPFQCRYRVREELPDVLFCIDVKNTANLSVYYANDDTLDAAKKRLPGDHVVMCYLPKYLLAPGEYRVFFGFWEPGHPPEQFPDVSLGFTQGERISRLTRHNIKWPSIIYTPARWDYDESGSPLR